jgi:polar amino acid transport system permease protein
VSATVQVGVRQAERAAAKRKRARRGQAIAVASSAIVLGGLAALILTSPGWPVFRDTFFSWSEFKSSFPDILDGFWLDVKLFLVSEVIVLICGLIIALIRTSWGPALLATVYTDVFRGIPILILVYLVGFGLPALDLTGVPTDPFVLSVLALSLAYTAYVAEVYRAGIRSVHGNQRQAALAIGLTETQALRHVILPQAVRRVAPPLLNDFVSLQKDVVLIAVIGPQEALRAAQIASGESFNYTPYVAAALLFLLVTIPLARIVDRYGFAGSARA